MLYQSAGRTGFPLNPRTPESHTEITKLSCLVCTPTSFTEPGAHWVGADNDGFYSWPHAAAPLRELEEGGGNYVTHEGDPKLGQGHVLKAGGEC